MSEALSQSPVIPVTKAEVSPTLHIPPTPTSNPAFFDDGEEDENVNNNELSVANHKEEPIDHISIQRNDKVIFQDTFGNDKTTVASAIDVIGIVIGEVKVKNRSNPYCLLVQRLGANNTKLEGMLYVLSPKEMRLADPEELSHFSATGSLHASS